VGLIVGGGVGLAGTLGVRGILRRSREPVAVPG